MLHSSDKFIFTKTNSAQRESDEKQAMITGTSNSLVPGYKQAPKLFREKGDPPIGGGYYYRAR